jgi:hypothetical protein
MCRGDKIVKILKLPSTDGMSAFTKETVTVLLKAFSQLNQAHPDYLKKISFV